MIAILIVMLATAQDEIRPLRPLRVELFQSGKIMVAGKPVPLNKFTNRLRAARRAGDILCVWREPKVLNGRAAFDIGQPGELEKLKKSMRATGIIMEASQHMPSFDQTDAPCQGSQ